MSKSLARRRCSRSSRAALRPLAWRASWRLWAPSLAQSLAAVVAFDDEVGEDSMPCPKRFCEPRLWQMLEGGGDEVPLPVMARRTTAAPWPRAKNSTWSLQAAPPQEGAMSQEVSPEKRDHLLGFGGNEVSSASAASTEDVFEEMGERHLRQPVGSIGGHLAGLRRGGAFGGGHSGLRPQPP